MVRDPVCGMEVDETVTDLKSECKGKTYYFCNISCKENFEKTPEQYVD